jgi:hypothetical protein
MAAHGSADKVSGDNRWRCVADTHRNLACRLGTFKRRRRGAVAPVIVPDFRHFVTIANTFPRLPEAMIETNPILARIADLKGRVESLRGYL